MRLFLRDHLSFVLLYLATFLGLPVIIHVLDGIEGHLSYFMFLAICLLLIFLVFRYTRRKNMYTHLEKDQVDDTDTACTNRKSLRCEDAAYSVFVLHEGR